MTITTIDGKIMSYNPRPQEQPEPAKILIGIDLFEAGNKLYKLSEMIKNSDGKIPDDEKRQIMYTIHDANETRVQVGVLEYQISKIDDDIKGYRERLNEALDAQKTLLKSNPGYIESMERLLCITQTTLGHYTGVTKAYSRSLDRPEEEHELSKLEKAAEQWNEIQKEVIMKIAEMSSVKASLTDLAQYNKRAESMKEVIKDGIRAQESLGRQREDRIRYLMENIEKLEKVCSEYGLSYESSPSPADRF